jgi:GMP synthase (glutamine-hydrolysing)
MILIIKAGDTMPAVKEKAGDFDRMFLSQLEGTVHRDRITIVQVHKGEPLPDPGAFTAAIITGSASSVTEREPWADMLAAWINRTMAAERPLLGVCYGHQLIAHAQGGRVARNPKGYEIGTKDVVLTGEGAKDALLGTIAAGRASIPFNHTHFDIVSELPPNATLLAKSAMSEVQAFRIGDRTWGVQFHPELTRPVMELYVEVRAPLIERDAIARGEDPHASVARARASIGDTADGGALLRLFVDRALAQSE